MPNLTNLLRVGLVAWSLSLGGCTNILGDFKYDARAGSGGNKGQGGAGSEVEQGDIVVSPTRGLITTEQGAKATFTLVLKRPPADNVAIALSSSNEAEGLVSPVSVTFTPENFDAPQTVSITGVDDELVDGNQAYTIRTSPASSSDESYAGIDAVDPAVRNVDDETAGFTLMPALGLTTTESGGEATFTIVLNAPPMADVSFALSSDNAAEGTVSPASLIFTPANYNAPQTVTATGVNDDFPDGPVTYHVVTGVATSTDVTYDKLDPDDAELINQDNDTAGVVLSPALGLFTAENGQMTSFGIALIAPPTADVVIGLSSGDPNEGTASPERVLFTPLNWMAPQLVTVTGVDDAAADGSQPYLVVTAPADSDDASYSGLDGPDAQLVNIDDDSPGIRATPTEGLETSETGEAATFSVVLNSKPSGDVVLDLSSEAPDEGTVSPATVAFTDTNWNAPQVVTVTGVDDNVADGAQPYQVHVSANPASGDAAYAALAEVDVALVNIDNDSAGISVSGQGGLTTGEQGMSATFTITLNSQPLSDVSVPLASSNTAEGTVTPATATFTPDNWAAAQVITVKGVNDNVADGSQPYRITTLAAQSADSNYNGINPANVDVINTDDDSPGISVYPTMALTTTEAGGTAQFWVVLNSQPTAGVSLGVSSNNTAEGTLSTALLTFTALNWNAPQAVTIKGQDDEVADGAQQYRVVLAAATSGDANYNGRDALDLTVSNTDNDSAGISVNAGADLTTTEAGGSASFQIVLNSRPTASVNIALSSNRPAEAGVSPASLTFTTANWNAPQTVTATGVDDKVADGNQSFRVLTAPSTSPDPKYAGIDVTDVRFSNTDNDSPGITVAPTAGLSTSEAGGTATFSVVLTSQPLADVTVAIRSSKVTEGTVSPASVTFTTTNWNAPRGVTVTGVNDDVADGAQPYSVITDAATSTDAKYAGLDAFDVAVSNVDNDSAGITVSAASGNTSEGATTATFTLVLNSQPTADVTIGLSSSDLTEGTLAIPSVTFTATNWAAPKQVTVTGVNDSVADGTQPYSIVTAAATSSDANYATLDPNDVSLSNTDNDSAGITISAASGNTSEAGGTATFTIVLNSQPTASVTVPVSSSNTDEGTLSLTSVVFTMMNWSSAQTITVTGVNDDVADGTQPYSIITDKATSTDAGYKDLNPSDVALSNVDNDSAGITVGAISGSTSEAGGSATFSIVLNSKPTADVSIGVSSNNTAEGTVSPSAVTFTTNNWSAKQTVTVTGVNDDVADGPQPYSVLTAAATSTDAGYKDLNADDVSLSNVDNDSAGVAVSDAAGTTSEAGGTTTFTVALNSKPTADVTIPITSGDLTEGTVNKDSLVFTTNNWAALQTVTISGVNDNVADGNPTYSILVGVATSTDLGYAGLDGKDVTVTNIDNDSAGITVGAAASVTTEAGGTTTFSVVLNSQPTASVEIPLASNNTAEGRPGDASLTFTTTNWAAPQLVTVTGQDDAIADGPQDYKIVLSKPTSADAAYAAIDPNDVDLSNQDNDSAGITVSAALGNTSEGGLTTSFSIVLNSQPTASVTIPVSVSDDTEAQLQVASVSFSTSNWATPKSVLVTGVNDDVADGPLDFTVVTGPATSTDLGYAARDAADVLITNLDNDSANVVVTQPVSALTNEDGTTTTFSVVLSSAPTATVTIALSSTRPAEGLITSPSPAELVFDASNWSTPRVVTVKGVQDIALDGNQLYTVELSPATSTDAGYSGFDAADVPLTNADDDGG